MKEKTEAEMESKQHSNLSIYLFILSRKKNLFIVFRIEILLIVIIKYKKKSIYHR